MLYFLIERKKNISPSFSKRYSFSLETRGESYIQLVRLYFISLLQKKGRYPIVQISQKFKNILHLRHRHYDVGSTFFKTDQKFNSFTFFFPQKTTIRVHKYTCYYYFCSPMTEYFHDLLINAPTSVLPLAKVI